MHVQLPSATSGIEGWTNTLSDAANGPQAPQNSLLARWDHFATCSSSARPHVAAFGTPSVRSTAELVFIRSSVHVQVILDTFLFTPVHVLGFFGWMNAVDGGTLQVVSARHLAIGCIYNSVETMP